LNQRFVLRAIAGNFYSANAARKFRLAAKKQKCE